MVKGVIPRPMRPALGCPCNRLQERVARDAQIAWHHIHLGALRQLHVWRQDNDAVLHRSGITHGLNILSAAQARKHGLPPHPTAKSRTARSVWSAWSLSTLRRATEDGLPLLNHPRPARGLPARFGRATCCGAGLCWGAGRSWTQSGLEARAPPNASRGSSSTRTFAACEPIGA